LRRPCDVPCDRTLRRRVCLQLKTGTNLAMETLRRPYPVPSGRSLCSRAMFQGTQQGLLATAALSHLATEKKAETKHAARALRRPCDVFLSVLSDRDSRFFIWLRGAASHAKKHVFLCWAARLSLPYKCPCGSSLRYLSQLPSFS